MSDNTIEKKDGKAGAEKKKAGGIFALIERVVLILGFTIFIGSMLASIFMPSARDLLSEVVNVIVSPISNTMPFWIAVLIIATIVTTFATIIQKYTMDWEMQRRIMQKNQVFQKEYREAQLSGNKKKVKQLEEERLKMMEEQAEMSKQQLKPMGFIAFVSIPLFWWAFWYLTTQQPNLHMFFPLIGAVKLTDGFFIFPYWVWWSMLCSFSISFVVRKALNVGVVTS